MRRRDRCCCFTGESCEPLACTPTRYRVWTSTTQAHCGVEAEGPWAENAQSPDGSGNADWVSCSHPQGLAAEGSPPPGQGVTRSVACRKWRALLPTYADAGMASTNVIGILGDVILYDVDGREYDGNFPGTEKRPDRYDHQITEGATVRLVGHSWTPAAWNNMLAADNLKVQLWYENSSAVVGPPGSAGTQTIRTQTLELGIDILPVLQRRTVQYRYTFIEGNKSGCEGHPVIWRSCDFASDNNNRVRIKLGLDVEYDDDNANVTGLKDASYLEAIVSPGIYQRFRLYRDNGIQVFNGIQSMTFDQPYEWVDYNSAGPVVTAGKHPDGPAFMHLDAYACGGEPPPVGQTCEVCPGLRFQNFLPDWNLTVPTLGTPSPCCPTLEGAWVLEAAGNGCTWRTPTLRHCDHDAIGHPGGYLENPDNFQNAGWALTRQGNLQTGFKMRLNPFYDGGNSFSLPIYELDLDAFDCDGPNTFTRVFDPTWRCRCCDPDVGAQAGTPLRLQLTALAQCDAGHGCSPITRCFQDALSSTHNAVCVHFGTGTGFPNSAYPGSCSWVTEDPVAYPGCTDGNGDPFIKTGFTLLCRGWWPADGTANGTQIWEARWGGVVWANYIGQPGNITGVNPAWDCVSNQFQLPLYSAPAAWDVSSLNVSVLERPTTGPRYQVCEFPETLTITPTSKILGC